MILRGRPICFVWGVTPFQITQGGNVYMTPREAIDFAREKEAQIVDLRFTDLPGTWQHFSMPVEALDESLFEEGIGFDGSSIRGFQVINESDMLLIPDPSTAFMDPFTEHPDGGVYL
jgi:glutamine synthetase